MTPHETFSQLLKGSEPLTALAPMQDVTDLEFMQVMQRYGGPDVYWTEYFRVTTDSRPEKYILRSITQNTTGRPVVAQLIGNDIPALVRNAKELQRYPVAAIDLNLGCPAPVVYRKCAGGGLLRDLPRIEGIIGALREAVQIPFTIKTRIGFESPAEFDALLQLFGKHLIDLLTVHGRTVLQMYRPGVRYDLIARAAKELPCPVLLNGNVFSGEQALRLVRETGVRGLMIGRGAIRNPWLFEQIRQRRRGEPERYPTGREVLHYINELWESQTTTDVRENSQVQRMKKFMNFIGEGVPSAEKFLYDMRRLDTKAGFFQLCEDYLDHDHPMPLIPSDSTGPASLGEAN